MTRILRLLLIAAIVLPMWQPVAAQRAVAAVEKGVPQLTDEISANEQCEQSFALNKDVSSQKGGVSPKGSTNPPSDAKIEQWTISTTFRTRGTSNWTQTNFWTSTVDVAIYGNTIYVRGLSYYVHDAWIKGTIDGTTVSFGDRRDFGLGSDGETYWLFARYFANYNSEGEWCDIEFTYNPGAKSLTLATGVRLYDCTTEPSETEGMITVHFLTYHTGTTISGSVEANQLCPVQGQRYYDDAQHSQLIYPESSIIFYKNSKLNSITFYTQNGLRFYNGKVTVSLAIINQDKFSSDNSSPVSATLTQVGSIVPTRTTSGGAWTITFDEAFEYPGGNLLVDIITEKGEVNQTGSWWNTDYETTSFYLETSDNYSSYYSNYYNNYGNTCIKYLPVVVFGYERMYEERDITIATPAEIAAISYSWKENGVGTQHSSTLDEIATDPDQIIAMLKEVYTNKSLPGNMRRGFTTEGTRDHDDVVPYTAVGKLSVSNGTATFNDEYGWQFTNDEVTKLNGTSGDYNYWYMDPDQYRPNKEGLTLLLLEMQDNFTPVTVTDEESGETLEEVVLQETSGYARLRECVEKTIKSARVISESRRTGEGMGKGTMFKIDCDKMNKFYLIAKGKLLWFSASSRETGKDFYDNPCWINGNGVDEYSDYGLSTDYNAAYPFLCQMFEQFSPAVSGSGITKDDIYQELTKNMQSFGVNHDCPNVPYVENGHHFMMYDSFSEAGDCADVRDMMFFIPDYRMMDHSTRAPNSGQDYFRYHPNIQPTMGMFVILQNEIPEGTKNLNYSDPNNAEVTGLYRHQLSWKSNLDDFLPGDMQEYELWEIVVDDFGVQSYQPVYYRNADGSYVLDDNGNKTPIVIERNNISDFIYSDVYVDMKAGSQTKTYVIRGRDKGHFLSLQMSNMEEIVIPGTDPNEKARMIGATYYSRYNPDNEKNCYSNKIELSNNGTTITAEDLTAAGNKIYFYRSSRAAKVDENGNVVTDASGNIQYEGDDNVTKTLVATGTANNGTITIVPENQSLASEFPVGKSDGNTAGYHPNTTLSFRYSTSSGVVQFTNSFSFWDNFTVDVSNNAHPLQYLYRMEMGTAGQDGYSYSNNVRVPVYKTDSKINPYTLSQVLNDKNGTVELKDVEFQAKVQLNSKTELLRYDAYRWEEKQKQNDHYYIIDEIGEDTYHNLVEGDLAPTGIAQNQGDYYTVTMNDVENQPEYYYVAGTEGQPTVSTSNPYNWATFVDYYPNGKVEEEVQANPGAYAYAPVVELYARGYKENEVNGNKVARNDYNTYGGPMKYAASGKLELDVQKNNDKPVQMSDYKWYQNGKWYSYYNILLKFTALDVPEGYELYKVRAWRKIDKSILGEEYYENGTHNRQARLNDIDADGWYLYEDINYGDQLTLPDTDGSFLAMNKTNYSDQLIGGRSVLIAKPQDPDVTSAPEPLFADGEENEIRATFGALRMVNDNDNNGTLEYLPTEFKVRAYFTRTSNPLISGNKSDVIYVVGDLGNGWNFTTPLATLYSNNGSSFSGTIEIPEGGNGFFLFSKKLGSTWSTNNQYLFGAESDGNAVVDPNWEFYLKYWGGDSKPFQIAPGKYKLTITEHVSSAQEDVNWYGGKLKIDKLTNTTTMAMPKAEAMTGSNDDYYIAEGTFEKEFSKNEIITGIVDVIKSSEVVGIEYYNVAGIKSNIPFQGVNIVVTRYSDGSIQTTKIIK